MRRLIFIFLAAMMTAAVMAAEKFSFVVEGSENTYNQVRVVNRTSLRDIHCRVVILDDNDNIVSVYGVYKMSGYDDADMNTDRIRRGTKIGIQFSKDFDHELSYSVEYRDYPLFDAVVVILTDKKSEFSDEF